MANHRSDWSKERIALLRKLWQTGSPCSEIANAISALPGRAMTKDACCGKARRLGLAPKPPAREAAGYEAWRSGNAIRAWQTRRENGTDRWGGRIIAKR